MLDGARRHAAETATTDLIRQSRRAVLLCAAASLNRANML